jgi:hypothetical protein
MQRLNTAYGMYFRFKHQRPGHCFQGRYGAKLVEGDSYILSLTRYVHLNPVKGERMNAVGMDRKREILREFAYSSYRGYAGLGKPEERIDYRWLELMERRTAGGRRQAYRRYVESMLVEDDEPFLEEAGKSRYVIGDERFREECEQELRQKRLERAATGDILWPEERRADVETVARVAVEVLGVRLADVRFHGHRLGARKAMVVEWCCRLSGATQREVGRYLGYKSDTAVGKARRKAREVLSNTPELAAEAEELEKRLAVVLKSPDGRCE